MINEKFDYFLYLKNKNNIMKLVVLRGLPGCGKSTLTQNIMKINPDAVVISNDILRIDNSIYNYDVTKNNEIHKLSYSLLVNSLINKEKLIIIDNCNLNLDMLEKYIELANDNGYNYIQLSFPKPEFKNLYSSFNRSRNGISFTSYKNLYQNYKNHYLDKNINNFDIGSLIE